MYKLWFGLFAFFGVLAVIAYSVRTQAPPGSGIIVSSPPQEAPPNPPSVPVLPQEAPPDEPAPATTPEQTVEPVTMPVPAVLTPPPPPPPPSSVKRLVGQEQHWPVRFAIGLAKADSFFDTGIPLVSQSRFLVRCTSGNCTDYVIRFGGHDYLLGNDWYGWRFTDRDNGIREETVVEPDFRSTIQFMIRNQEPRIELEIKWHHEGSCSWMNTPQYNRICDMSRDWAYGVLERTILPTSQ